MVISFTKPMPCFVPRILINTIKPMSKQVARRYPWILRQMNNLDDNGDIKEVLSIEPIAPPKEVPKEETKKVIKLDISDEENNIF